VETKTPPEVLEGSKAAVLAGGSRAVARVAERALVTEGTVLRRLAGLPGKSRIGARVDEAIVAIAREQERQQ